MIGGLEAGTLAILAARPSVGKTALALNIARNAAEAGHCVAFFSLEMSAGQIWLRWMAQASGVPLWRLRRAHLLTQEEHGALASARGAPALSRLIQTDRAGLRPDELHSIARRSARRQPLGLIVVDYLQLMTPPPGSGKRSRNDDVSAISGMLKYVAKDLQVPVLALSQLSRAVEMDGGREPQLNDLRDSGAIEQDADVVMFLHRPRTGRIYFGGRQDTAGNYDADGKLTKLLLAKHRQGETGDVPLHYDGDRTLFVAADLAHMVKAVPLARGKKARHESEF
jgi:replicative DNA helicase